MTDFIFESVSGKNLNQSLHALGQFRLHFAPGDNVGIKLHWATSIRLSASWLCKRNAVGWSQRAQTFFWYNGLYSAAEHRRDSLKQPQSWLPADFRMPVIIADAWMDEMLFQFRSYNILKQSRLDLSLTKCKGYNLSHSRTHGFCRGAIKIPMGLHPAQKHECMRLSSCLIGKRTVAICSTFARPRQPVFSSPTIRLWLKNALAALSVLPCARNHLQISGILIWRFSGKLWTAAASGRRFRERLSHHACLIHCRMWLPAGRIPHSPDYGFIGGYNPARVERNSEITGSDILKSTPVFLAASVSYAREIGLWATTFFAIDTDEHICVYKKTVR